MESRRYDYGSDAGTGGKIHRHPPSSAVAASPYARPATAPKHPPGTATAAVSQGAGWLSRIIAAGTSRFLPSLFRTSPTQLTAPAPPPLELLEPPSRDQLPVDAPPSPLLPPLEDDLPECEENGRAAANNLCTENPQSSAKGEEENMLRNSDDHGGMALEELLKQRTFMRSEFEYLADLLWSKTIGANSLKPEDGNIRKMIVYDKENGSEHSNLPLDFSTRTYSVDDQVASPTEIAKAYMGSKSSKGSPLRLGLHDPSSMPITSIEASMAPKGKRPTIPLAQGSRLHTSKTSDHLEGNYTTPNGGIYKMSSSPYFKSVVSSKELFGSVSSHYQTSSSVHTFGRQVLKRKSTAVSNESLSAGPIRRMRQRYNRTLPLLETWVGYRRYPVAYVSELEGPEQLAQTQKRRCLDKVGDTSLGSIDDRAHVNCFDQAPEQSAEMAAKILKQLDTLVPPQEEKTPEIKRKFESAIYFEEDVSRQKNVQAERDLLEPSPTEVEYSLPDGITSNKSISQITLNKEKPPAFSFRVNAPNLVLSDEIGQNKMSTPANGFTFPVPTVNNAHSQGRPTPTLASPPILTVEKQPSLFFSASVTSAESGPRISKSVLGGPVTQKLDSKLDDQRMPSKNSGQGASFTSNPVFKVDGPGYASNSIVSDIQPSNTSIGLASFQSAGSSTISTNLASKSTQSCSTGGSLFSWAAASGPTSVIGTARPSSATSSSFAFSSSPAFLAQPVFASKLTTPAPPSYGSPNTGPATSPFSPMPSAVFSFTSSTPSVPNPPTPISGDPTVQMNGGNMVVDRNGSPFPATSQFGLPSSSPSTPTFSTPATRFASSTSGSPGVFEVGQYSQVSSGGFSMGPSGGNNKSGRRIIRVKRRK